jgi:hypothetical protein
LAAAIELALAAAGFAADYRAGAAESGSARALVLEDARGHRAVFTQTEFRITGAVADFVAARLLISLDLERPELLFHWSGIGAAPSSPTIWWRPSPRRSPPWNRLRSATAIARCSWPLGIDVWER